MPSNMPAQFYSSIFGWKVRTRGDGELAFDDPGGVSGTWVFVVFTDPVGNEFGLYEEPRG